MGDFVFTAKKRSEKLRIATEICKDFKKIKIPKSIVIILEQLQERYRDMLNSESPVYEDAKDYWANSLDIVRKLLRLIKEIGKGYRDALPVTTSDLNSPSGRLKCYNKIIEHLGYPMIKYDSPSPVVNYISDNQTNDISKIDIIMLINDLVSLLGIDIDVNSFDIDDLGEIDSYTDLNDFFKFMTCNVFELIQQLLDNTADIAMLEEKREDIESDAEKFAEIIKENIHYLLFYFYLKELQVCIKAEDK